MLKIPLNDIIAKIQQEKGLSDQEINQKINQKLEQLSGLISKEGAAHIVANELGVKVFEQVSGKLQIKNILAGMRSVETVGKITQKYELREFQTQNRSGKVANMVIGDETGSIRVVMWGDQAENINNVKEGDIIKVIGGYVRENQGKSEVHLNDRSKIIINPEGETIGEVKTFAQAERKQISQLTDNQENIELLGTIVQAFNPTFYEVHPETGRRIKPNEANKYIDDSGKEVQPDYAYVMNLMLDDGSDTIRCTFFRNQAERLLNKSKEEMLTFKDNPQEFEAMKTELLGNIVKLVGRVKHNEMFDRLEFTTQLVFLNPDPEEEMNKIETPQETEAKLAAATGPEPAPQNSPEQDPVQKQQEEVKTEVENIN